MTQGLEQNHIHRCAYLLKNMVNEKQDRGLFVAFLRFCRITISYLNFLAKRVVQHITHHIVSCSNTCYDPKLVRATHYNHLSYYMEPLEHTISAQIAKYPKLVILGLSQTTDKCRNEWSRSSDIPKKIRGLKENHFNRFG